MNSFEVWTPIPLYKSCSLLVNVSDDLHAARSQHTDKFGKLDGPRETDGAIATHDRKGFCAIFFSRKYLLKGIIAHEVFHVVSYIMDHIGQKYHRENHEAFAYLTEWITEWLYDQLERAGEPVHRAKRELLKKSVDKKRKRRQSNHPNTNKRTKHPKKKKL